MPFHLTPLLPRAAMNPVLTIEQVEQAVARALMAGGLPLIEVAVRIPALAESASVGTAKVPDAVLGIVTGAHGGSLAVVTQ